MGIPHLNRFLIDNCSKNAIKKMHLKHFKNKVVVVEIRCIFGPKSIKLPSGATVPTAYRKTIKYDKVTEVYYFKNEKPLSTDFTKYKI
jgi:hypothetical protein